MPELEWLILDMGGVTGLDRSAAAAVLKLCDVMRADSAAATETDAVEPRDGGSPASAGVGDRDDGEGSADPQSELRQRAGGGATAGAEAAAQAAGSTSAVKKLSEAGKTRMIVVGLSPGLREFVETSSGHGGEADMVTTVGDGDGDSISLRKARMQGALPLFRRSVDEAVKVVIAAQRSKAETA